MADAAIAPLGEAVDPACYGGKAAQLSHALNSGLPVPPGFAVSDEALRALADGDAALASRVSSLFAGLGGPVAARSSGIGEDAADASFAGQHLTVLNLLDASQLHDALMQVYRSAHAPAALAYRQKKGIAGDVRMAAVVQRLIDADCAGVLFTRNPLSGADELVIEASWGLGEAVVAGLVTPDHYRVSRAGRVLEVRIGEKDLAIIRKPDGHTQEVEVAPERAQARCLDDARLSRLASMAAAAERAFGPALDLEWAFHSGQLHLLQSRPISTR